jgi:hypothetical protein
VSKFDEHVETVNAIQQQTGNDVSSDIISMHEGHKLMMPVDPNSVVDNGVSESVSLKSEVGNLMTIKKAGDINHGVPHFGCLKLTKWNPLILQELPIPFFVKEIMMETVNAPMVEEDEVGSFAFTCSKTIGNFKFLKFLCSSLILDFCVKS